MRADGRRMSYGGRMSDGERKSDGWEKLDGGRKLKGGSWKLLDDVWEGYEVGRRVEPLSATMSKRCCELKEMTL